MPNLNHEATASFKLREGDESGQPERVKRALDRLEGVLEVRINFVLDTVSIRYDSKKVSREQIKEKVDGGDRDSGPSKRPSYS
jgi:copper chaperone CopZ